MIVSGHCGQVFSGDRFRYPAQGAEFLFDLIVGATALFVFISGFLFQRNLKEDFDYVPFLKKKAVNLLLPYGVVTAVYCLLAAASNEIHDPASQTTPLLFLSHYSEAFLLGSVGISFWYIPFIYALFMLSPLFVRTARAPTGIALTVAAAFFLVGLFVNRPTTSYILPVQQIAYFGPYFMAGMLCMRWRPQFEAFVSRPSTLAVSLLAAFVLAYLQMHYGQPGNLHGEPFEPIAFDYKYLQKLVLCIAICSILMRFEDKRMPALDLVASYSFGIFFLHEMVIGSLLGLHGVLPDLPENTYANLALSSAIVMGYTTVAVYAIKAVGGKRSKYLIGS